MSCNKNGRVYSNNFSADHTFSRNRSSLSTTPTEEAPVDEARAVSHTVVEESSSLDIDEAYTLCWDKFRSSVDDKAPMNVPTEFIVNG